MNKKRKKAVDKSTRSHLTNKYDFLINLTDALYDTINSGNIIGIIAVIILLIIWKLPPENINTHVTTLTMFITREKYYFVPMGILSCFTVYIIFYQRKIHKEEMRRHADLRFRLIHGRENGELQPLKEHKSSKYNPDDEE